MAQRGGERGAQRKERRALSARGHSGAPVIRADSPTHSRKHSRIALGVSRSGAVVTTVKQCSQPFSIPRSTSTFNLRSTRAHARARRCQPQMKPWSQLETSASMET